MCIQECILPTDMSAETHLATDVCRETYCHQMHMGMHHTNRYDASR